MEIVVLIILIGFLTLLIVVGLQVIFSLLTMTHFHGAYYAGSSQERLTAILDLAKFSKTDTILDIGSGDGRIVIAAAQQGAKATGIEINPRYVWSSKKRIKKAGLDQSATILRGDFWVHDFSPYTVITVYGIKYIMEDLAKKIKSECSPGTRVISVYFQFPNWQIKKSQDDCHMYVVD